MRRRWKTVDRRKDMGEGRQEKGDRIKEKGDGRQERILCSVVEPACLAGTGAGAVKKRAAPDQAPAVTCVKRKEIN